MSDTLTYYNDNAESFVDSTFDVPMEAIYRRFLPYVPEGGHILDAGCGSGRDALHFHSSGYRVTAFDASHEIVSLAAQKTGLPVVCRSFLDVSECQTYDGIWACASLLHLPERKIPEALDRLWTALKPEGVLYASFKVGERERESDGRHFTDATEQRASTWFESVTTGMHIEFWRTADQRPDRNEQWLNMRIIKVPPKHNRLTVGGQKHHFLPKLCQSIHLSSKVDMAVAFVKTTGLNLLLPDLLDVLQRNVDPARVRILTSDYLDITDPEALRKLTLLQDHGAQVCIYESKGSSFHMKAYLFSGGDKYGAHWGRAFIGSSNISKQALQDGLEWNYQIDYPGDAGYLEATSRFDELFLDPKVVPLTDQWIDEYTRRRVPPPRSIAPGSTESEPPPVPTDVQKSALAALDQSRNDGYSRGLVVLATGLGKTWLSAFDAKQMGAHRILFVAHREEILNQAAETFIRIKPESRVGFYSGKQRDRLVDVLCASIQTLGKEVHLDNFPPQYFDYVVVDEFHHAAAPTYHRLLKHFAPRFMLGLTATPDRTDRSDILSLCDDNLVYEYPLFDGVRGNYLVPFHYYGIYDEAVEYQEIPWRNGKFAPDLLATKLATAGRARHALRVWKQHKQVRTLAFCVSRSHADFMAEYFKRNDIRAASVHGESEMSRGEALESLESGDLEIIFSVDLFNEGVDLPAIDTVLLLRPTESKVLFLQQIGRGLRRSVGKDKLVILDFVGNHHSFLHKPQALMGQAMNLREVAEFARKAERKQLDLPEGCFVNYDLEIIDFLKGLDKKGSEKDYQALKDTLGRRPTLTEYYHFGANIKNVRKQHGSWFGFLGDMGDLSQPEMAVKSLHSHFMEEVEKTSMAKSFKMILLEAFQSLDGWENGVNLAALADESWSILKRRPRLFAEITDSVSHSGKSSVEWRKYWKRNPVDHWTNKSPALFSIDGDRFEPTFNVEQPILDNFEAMVQELIDYRLASYEARQAAKSDSEAIKSVVPLASKGTELPFFPSLKIACGHFRNSLAELENVDYRSLQGGYGRLSRERHFIALASGNSMNGGKNPIHDGDYLLLEQISSNAAGKITGETLAIERLDEAGDTQYLLRNVRKSSEGQYVLEAANPDYDDIFVTRELAEQFRTFARLKAVISPLEMARGQELLREDIPNLFGAVFNAGSWNSGHVFVKEAGAHILLVTLNKQGKSAEHRYVDHWVDENTFHWQSQNSTTPESKRGRELINHKRMGFSVHLFVRENKLLNGKAAPFVYHGPVEYKSHEGSAPMSVLFQLTD
ncbi:DUF3427 domain-containing protein [Microbulbifer salipaludis]|uniref:DUF3427 domain-containing protein n=1 Tax=Microbulbifer salipaludis TaxID=187980 RepID=A0ABS3E5U4_9GAMM|nr:DUF3427 domain-containing protein [Microbulbifer salipaludis]MBN8430588.1 DUF3427 domain-containing protein [Microbulbifer salipaludis]